MKNSFKKYKLIYNPTAGQKRAVAGLPANIGLNEALNVLRRYKISADVEETKYHGHAKEIAESAVKHGYDAVISAGGDGTISEIAGVLTGKKVVLGILPFGTYMNIPKMLHIPQDVEKAAVLIRAGNVLKIDAGAINVLSGKKLSPVKYFFENSGIGFEAEMQKHFGKLEKGNWFELFNLLKIIWAFYFYRARIILDSSTEIKTRASTIMVSNGPLTGAGLTVAPGAKLDDHRLTVSVYKMSRWGVLKFVIGQKFAGRVYSKDVKRYKAKSVRIETRKPRLVHADSRIFGKTPVEYSILPKALNVITGFSKDWDIFLPDQPEIVFRLE